MHYRVTALPIQSFFYLVHSFLLSYKNTEKLGQFHLSCEFMDDSLNYEAVHILLIKTGKKVHVNR